MAHSLCSVNVFALPGIVPILISNLQSFILQNLLQTLLANSEMLSVANLVPLGVAHTPDAR